jgi:hypothetical protein
MAPRMCAFVAALLVAPYGGVHTVRLVAAPNTTAGLWAPCATNGCFDVYPLPSVPHFWCDWLSHIYRDCDAGRYQPLCEDSCMHRSAAYQPQCEPGGGGASSGHRQLATALCDQGASGVPGCETLISAVMPVLLEACSPGCTPRCASLYRPVRTHCGPLKQFNRGHPFPCLGASAGTCAPDAARGAATRWGLWRSGGDGGERRAEAARGGGGVGGGFVLEGSAFADASGAHFTDVLGDCAQAHHSSFAQDGRFAVEIWLSPPPCGAAAGGGRLSGLVFAHGRFGDGAWGVPGGIEILWECGGGSSGAERSTGALSYALQDNAHRRASFQYRLVRRSPANAWVHVLLSVQPRAVVTYIDGTYVADSMYVFPAQGFFNVAHPNPGRLRAALGEFFASDHSFVGGRASSIAMPDDGMANRASPLSPPPPFPGIIAGVGLYTDPLDASSARCLFQTTKSQLPTLGNTPSYEVIVSVMVDSHTIGRMTWSVDQNDVYGPYDREGEYHQTLWLAAGNHRFRVMSGYASAEPWPGATNAYWEISAADESPIVCPTSVTVTSSGAGTVFSVPAGTAIKCLQAVCHGVDCGNGECHGGEGGPIFCVCKSGYKWKGAAHGPDSCVPSSESGSGDTGSMTQQSAGAAVVYSLMTCIVILLFCTLATFWRAWSSRRLLIGAADGGTGGASTGLSAQELDALSVTVVTSPPEQEEDSCTICSICLEAFVEGELMHRLACQHPYHLQCIRPWLAMKTTCPACRSCTVTTNPVTADM